MTPIDMVYRAAALRPDAIAVEAGEARLCYAELVARANGVAAALRQVAGAPGARIGICACNSLEHLIAFLGVFAAGHVWVPLYPRLGAAELPRLAEFAEVTGQDNWSLVKCKPWYRTHSYEWGTSMYNVTGTDLRSGHLRTIAIPEGEPSID